MAVIRQEVQEKELEQLVSLAEDVANKIESLRDEYKASRPSSIIDFFITKVRGDADTINTKITQEKSILLNLLDMIHSYKEHAYHDMSVVSRAVFEMRLNRIHFSVGDGLEMPRE